jgi:SNF2 family DNA or RNA helicase
LPQVIKSNKNRFGIRWLPAMISKEVKQIERLLEQLMPEGTIAFNFVENGKRAIKMSKTEEQANILTSIFLRHFITKAFLESEKYYEKDVELLFFYEEYISFSDFDSKEIPRLVHLWLSKFFITKKDYIPLIKVEETDGYFKLQLFIENRLDESQPLISIEELFTNNELEDIKVGALQDIALLIEHFPDIEKLLQNEDYTLLYSFQEFTEVLLKTLPAIQLFGIKILLPKALRKLAMPKASMEIFADDESGEVGQTSGISLDNLLNFNWKVAVGDQLIPADDFEKMVKGLSGIVKIKDQYVLVDGKEMEFLLEKIKNPPKVSSQEILQSALAEEYNGATVVLNSKAQKILNDLLNVDTVKQPKNLLATLRPYQERGYEWLYKNSKIGFGSLIADDMGLGKTLQVITTLLKFKQEGLLKKQKALVILPTTLLTNWEKEIIKFAPELDVQVYHGSNRKLNVKAHDIILTTYGIARSETTELSKIRWQVIILDEAQNIKNPQTGQTKAIKKLKGNIKIAMTGTPVENRLSEYWSIFDFINKGYLFGLKKFKDKFARPIELDRDKHTLDQFRKITSPFILRRLKTDKTIIQDLPDKIETNQFCHLTKKQAALYQNVVNNMLQQVEEKEAIERRGLILKLLTGLKQICNHPSQYLKLSDIKADESGKTELLLDLLRQIFNANQKVIIFTQYRQMGDLLMKLIREELNVDVPFLHGGVSRKNRDLMVDNFQEKPYVKAMLISLKAGGTGLNLTAASNVIHYDLWWNPAVEAQATDRAYRIGQKQNVQVHRFITEKTFEEKIDKLIQSKKELANLAVASGENWLGDMTNADLKELVRLE